MTFSIDDRGHGSLQAQLYNRLRQAILSGQLRPGERVPPTRALAAQLDVSRTTVVLTYEQLLAEGYLESTRGAGTFVSGHLPDDAVRAASIDSPNIATRVHPVRRLSLWAHRVKSLGLLSADNGERSESPPIDFRPGRPDWAAFPHHVWSRLAARRWRQHSDDLASYGDAAGYRPLREAIARHLGLSRGVRCTADQVVVVNGSQQGFDLLLRIWLDAGDCVALEDPGYAGAALAAKANGAEVLPIPVSDDGLEVAALPAPDSSRTPRLVYVTPSHQFPTGATMRLPHRMRLLEWAARAGALVVEDDYDSDFRYTGRPLESLQGLDRSGVVAYLGSFSTALFPPLRVGYVVLPTELARPYVAAKWLADRQTATPDQQVLTDFMDEGHFGRHLRRMRRLYLARREALLDALCEHLDGMATPGGDGAGLHLVAWLSEGVSATSLARAAETLGVIALPLTPYYQAAAPREGLILGFAALQPESIRTGVERLAVAAKSVRRLSADNPRKLVRRREPGAEHPPTTTEGRIAQREADVFSQSRS